MSVYRPRRPIRPGEPAPQGEAAFRSPFWHYKFDLAGVRYSGSTGQRTKRAAQQYEEGLRRKIASGEHERERRAAEEAAARVDHAAMTLQAAASRWWLDVGQHKRSSSTSWLRIACVLRLFGKETPIGDIKTATVSDAIQRRRAELVRGRPVANATVNRDVIDTLRPILSHVEALYEDDGLVLPRIKWGRLRLPERGEINREFTDEQVKAWAAALGPVERVFLGFALTYGPRFGEMFFPPSSLVADDPGGPYVLLGRYKGRDGWRDVRKDGTVHRLPLEPGDARLLAALASRAAAAGLDVIWFDLVNGEPREISYGTLRKRLLRGAELAKIPPGRIIHGMRHHAGTSILRATGNLMLARSLLGHSDVATTQRYAHAGDADLRAGLAAVRRNSAGMIAHAPKKDEKPEQ